MTRCNSGRVRILLEVMKQDVALQIMPVLERTSVRVSHSLLSREQRMLPRWLWKMKYSYGVVSP
jgi:hypothetical protein